MLMPSGSGGSLASRIVRLASDEGQAFAWRGLARCEASDGGTPDRARRKACRAKHLGGGAGDWARRKACRAKHLGGGAWYWALRKACRAKHLGGGAWYWALRKACRAKHLRTVWGMTSGARDGGVDAVQSGPRPSMSLPAIASATL